MPTKKTADHARTMKRGRKPARTKTADIGAKELEPIQGKRGTKSAKQAIGIALSKARPAKEIVAPSKNVKPKSERKPAKRLKAKSTATTSAGKAKPSLKRATRAVVAPRARPGRHSARRTKAGAAPRSRTKRATSVGK